MSGAVGQTSDEGGRPASPRYAGEFAGRLEAWGGAHRVIVATLGLGVLLVGVGLWPLAIVGPYLAVAVATLLSARRNPRTISETPLGSLLLAMDVLSVTALAYAWGTSVSPVTWMNVPLVLGWTLVTRRHFGRTALLAVLGVTGTILIAEQLGWVPTAPATSLARPIDGRQRLFFFGSFALALAAGHVLVSHVVARLAEHAGVLSRIEAQRRMRAKEDELAARLEQTQRLQALGRLAGGVAHDFNNMLMGISGRAELAALRVEANPREARRALAELTMQIERAAKLTGRLLDYARQQPHEPVSTDVASLVTDRRPLLEQLLRSRVRLGIEGQPGCWVRIDPAELSRLLLNLAANAADAVEAQGKLTIRVRRDGDRVRLRVRDDGSGIAAEHLPHVFEPFFTTKPVGEATGLGLSAAYGIVRRSHGEISLESTPGVGTTVTITWPVAEPGPKADGDGGAAAGAATPAPADPPAHEASLDARAASDHASPLLLVDDDDDVRGVVRAQLEAAGYTVEAVADGRTALQRARAQPPDHYRMLITDVRMPGLGGAELAEQFASHSPRTPVLFVSGYTDDSLGEAARLGPLLEKPFTGAHLLAAVEQVLASR